MLARFVGVFAARCLSGSQLWRKCGRGLGLQLVLLCLVRGFSGNGRAMMRVAFYAEHLSERGTGVALFDYATQNRAVLGNDSVVFYDHASPHNNPDVVARFGAELQVIPCAGFGEADAMFAREGCEMVYAIKAGRRDGLVSLCMPTMVHGVFPVSTSEVHRSSYAFVSKWLANWCSGGKVPIVPHIARIGQTDADMREELGIPEDALVFGCYGGRDSFDIGFVRDQFLPRLLAERPDIWLIFMNIAPFLAHDRVVHLSASVDLEVKAAFINTCDAMLHSRARGETFGMAVAEFSLRGKPVLTYGRSRERAHLAALGEHGIVYDGAEDLCAKLVGFDRSMRSAARPMKISLPQSR